MDRFNRCSALSARQLLARLALVSAAIVGFNGCSDGAPKPDASTMASISGSVMVDGKPVTKDSNIAFYCPDKGATAAGKIDALGKFSLTAADAKIGMPAGRYQVMIRPPDAPPVKIGTDDYKKMMMGGTTTGGMPQKPPERATDIPSKFHDYATSEVELEVKPGPNTFDLDLAKLAR
jgi:hypothetical protein